MKAFLMECFVGFGLGHYYVGNYTLFIGKFLFYYFSCYFSFCVMVFVGAINQSNVTDEAYQYTKTSTIILLPLMIFWWFFDIFMFGTGRYTDGLGMPLA